MLEENKKTEQPCKEEKEQEVFSADEEQEKLDGRRFNKGRPRVEKKLRMVYVRLTSAEIDTLDELVQVEFTTRSGLIRRALHFFLDSQRKES